MNDSRKTIWLWPEPRKPSDDQKDKQSWGRFVPVVALALGIPAAIVALTVLAGKLQPEESKVIFELSKWRSRIRPRTLTLLH